MLVGPDDKFINRVIAKTIIGPYAPVAPLITKASKVASLGSCFAEEISKVLRARELDVEYFFLDELWNSAFALDGILTSIMSGTPVRLGRKDEWAEMNAEKMVQIRQRLQDVELFIFTFGLSLCWFNSSGALVLKEQVNVSKNNATAHVADSVMRQTTVEENEAAILRCLQHVRQLSPKASIVMTLSPVPLLGTLAEIPSVPANTISKAVLRLALDKVHSRKLEGVYYWPSYEIVTWHGCHVDRAFGDEDRDARHVRQKVIDLVGDLFVGSYVGQSDS